MDAPPPRFRREDRIGLVVAIALHAAVVVAFLIQPMRGDVMAVPERMSVSLVSDVSLESTAPKIVTESRAAIAPTISEEPQPSESEPEPVVEAPPQPAPEPARATQPTERPIAAPRNQRRQARQPEPVATPTQPSGGSRIGDDFLPAGVGDSTETTETEAPALTFGRQERAALSSAITRQLRRHWTAPNGIDAELLRSEVRWSLNPDGSLRGRPRCTNIASSVTDSNRPQAALHCERAIRAVQLAAPFNLPEPFYNRWKDLVWEFNRRL